MLSLLFFTGLKLLNVLFEIFNKTFDCCLFCCYYCLHLFLVRSVLHAISSLVPDCKIQQYRLLQSHNVLPPSLGLYLLGLLFASSD